MCIRDRATTKLVTEQTEKATTETIETTKSGETATTSSPTETETSQATEEKTTIATEASTTSQTGSKSTNEDASNEIGQGVSTSSTETAYTGTAAPTKTVSIKDACLDTPMRGECKDPTVKPSIQPRYYFDVEAKQCFFFSYLSLIHI